MDVLVALFIAAVCFIGYYLILLLLQIPKLSRLSSRFVLITGCDTGFGNAAAKRCDAMGYNVIAACLTDDGQTELRKSASDRMKVIQLDVTKHESVLGAYEEVKKYIPPTAGKLPAQDFDIFSKIIINVLLY